MSARARADEFTAKKARANGHNPLEILSFADLQEPNLNTRSLVKGLLENTAIALIYGESGSGKTFLALDLALHIASGREWFGLAVTKGRVVYVAAEAGRSIRNRVAAFALQECGDQTEVDFAAVVSPVDLCHLGKSDDMARLIATIGNAKVVVIDTVSRALAGGNENAPDDMGAFVTAMDHIRDKLGCAVIAVHHVGKDPSRGGRGHSLLHCAVDTEIEVERRDGGVSVATLTKQRDGPGGKQIAFKLIPVQLGRDQDNDPVTSCVVKASDWVPPPKAKIPTGQAKEALAVLNQAIAKSEEKVRAGDIEVRAVTVDNWHENLEKSGLFGEGANFRVAWGRVRRSLSADGHVFIKDGFVWPAREEPPF